MDLAAYDHIAEQTYSPGSRASTPTPASTPSSTGAGASVARETDNGATPRAPARQNLQTEFQETFRAFSNSAWGARLGGLWGNVRKQGENYLEEAKKEAVEVVGEVERGLGGLRFGSLSEERQEEQQGEGGASRAGVQDDAATASAKELQENETFIARFKTEAAKRLKEVQKAEDAADEALLRFGTNIRNFLREAVTVAPPSDNDNRANGTEILFESKDPSSGKRVFHTSRLEAQLHAIHTTLTTFTQDPSGSGDHWDDFKRGFDIGEMTDRIAKDLDRYKELRSAMEKLVPEKVEYKDFWARYYFLRHVVEVQEERRRELLKASSNDTEEVVAWDEESDDDEHNNSTTAAASSSTLPIQHRHPADAPTPPKVLLSQNTNDSSSTVHATLESESQPAPQSSSLKPGVEGRRSHDEKSVADSDASYDLVSGATSRAPGSPKEASAGGNRADESDEEDWE